MNKPIAMPTINPDLSAYKVLIVDDEPAIRHALEFLVSHAGYQTYTAICGEEALEKAAQYKPDVILLDVMMPGMDGYETARLIRNDDQLDHSRIIFLTARGASRDRSAGYDSGAEIYLTKPFDNTELMHTLEELIRYG
jgi:DNA-binding response OmpR family regulator